MHQRIVGFPVGTNRPRQADGIQLPVDGGLTSRSSLPDISAVLADAAAGGM